MHTIHHLNRYDPDSIHRGLEDETCVPIHHKSKPTKPSFISSIEEGTTVNNRKKMFDDSLQIRFGTC